MERPGDEIGHAHGYAPEETEMRSFSMCEVCQVHPATMSAYSPKLGRFVVTCRACGRDVRQTQRQIR